MEYCRTWCGGNQKGLLSSFYQLVISSYRVVSITCYSKTTWHSPLLLFESPQSHFAHIWKVHGVSKIRYHLFLYFHLSILIVYPFDTFSILCLALYNFHAPLVSSVQHHHQIFKVFHFCKNIFVLKGFFKSLPDHLIDTSSPAHHGIG